MSVNFSANQYEQEFEPKKLQNWQIPKPKGKYPTRHEGFSKIHANNRGHLLPNVPKSRESPWGAFVGTWDLPTKIPGNRELNPTARREDVTVKMQVRKEEADEVLKGQLKKTKIPSPMPQRIDPNDPYDTTTNAACVDPVTAAILEQTKLPGGDVSWPKQHGSESPVGHQESPKPVTPMNLGGEAVQREARNLVSPMNPEQVAVKGAVATPPMEPVGEQMRTPMEWPMARSTEPPEC